MIICESNHISIEIKYSDYRNLRLYLGDKEHDIDFFTYLEWIMGDDFNELEKYILVFLSKSRMPKGVLMKS